MNISFLLILKIEFLHLQDFQLYNQSKLKNYYINWIEKKKKKLK